MSTVYGMLHEMIGRHGHSYRAKVYESQFNNAKKSTPLAYIFSLILMHRLYLGQIGITFLLWAVTLVTLGAGGLLWWFVDLFLIPSMVAKRNDIVASDIYKRMTEYA